jgi:hypothetical protein
LKLLERRWLGKLGIAFLRGKEEIWGNIGVTLMHETLLRTPTQERNDTSQQSNLGDPAHNDLVGKDMPSRQRFSPKTAVRTIEHAALSGNKLSVQDDIAIRPTAHTETCVLPVSAMDWREFSELFPKTTNLPKK